MDRLKFKQLIDRFEESAITRFQSLEIKRDYDSGAMRVTVGIKEDEAYAKAKQALVEFALEQEKYNEIPNIHPPMCNCNQCISPR